MSGNEQPIAKGSKGRQSSTITKKMPPDADYELFMSMDLKASESVKKYIPLLEKKGELALVPIHIRGYSTNPREVLHRIRHFRRLGMEMQKKERQTWIDMSRKEKDKYKQNIEDLVALKLKLIVRDVEWKDVTPEFEALWNLEKAEKEARKSKPKRASKTSSQQAALHSPYMGTQTPQQLPGTTVGSTSAVARGAVVSDPPAAPPSDNENVDPQVRVLSMDLVPVQLEKPYCGLASDLELRTETAQEAKKRARNDTRRLIGAHAETLDQQGDAMANLAIKTAMVAFGKAADTAYFPGWKKGLPRRSLVLLDVNQVVENTATGGKIGQGDVTRKKMCVTITGSTDKEELVEVLKNVIRSMKHGNENSPTHELKINYRDAQTKLVSTTVARENQNAKASRAQPLKKHRTGQEIIDGQHE
jgi:hypothetical protein